MSPSHAGARLLKSVLKTRHISKGGFVVASTLQAILMTG